MGTGKKDFPFFYDRYIKIETDDLSSVETAHKIKDFINKELY